MSVGPMTWVFENSPYKGTERCIHLAIADVVNDDYDFEFWMTPEKVAKKAHCGVASVRRALARMVKDGYLELIEQGGGRGRTSRYRFLKPDQDEQVSQTESCSSADSKPDHLQTETCSSADSYIYKRNGTQEEQLNVVDGVDDGPDSPMALCTLLADLIEGNGSKRPTITKAWLDAARLMVERDGRTPEQIRKAAEWCQGDEFWRANVLSMPTLRRQFDKLRLSAKRGTGPPPPRQMSRADISAESWDRNAPEGVIEV